MDCTFLYKDNDEEESLSTGLDCVVDNVHHLYRKYDSDSLNLKTFDHNEYKMYEIDNENDPENHFYNQINRNCKYYTDEQFCSTVKTGGSFSIIHFNSRSLHRNYSKIKDYLSKFKKFSVIATSETWLDNEKTHNVELDGYELFTTNRNSKKGGGVALYVDDALRCRLVKSMSNVVTDIMECLTIEISVEKFKNIVISCVYRTPGSCVDTFNEHLANIFGNLNNNKIQICKKGKADEDPDKPETDEEKDNDVPSFPGPEKVSVEDDLVNQPACIAFNSSLACMVNFLQLPIKKCYYREDQMGTECDATPPFQVKFLKRGSATIIEWSHYFIDSIKEFWEKKRAAIIDRLRAKDSVVALADGRMDSPGHTAQYCTYTTMENESKDIISVVTVDKRQTNRNSVIMEKHAFIQMFDSLLENLNITEIVTDAHMQIAALMDPKKGRYKDKGVLHSLDICHAAKNLTKKLHAARIVKGHSILLVWLRDIFNQFWYIFQKAEHRDMFNDMWVGVLYHVTGKHEWTCGKCDHGPLDEATRDKELMVPGSAPHEVLQRVMFNRRWLKDVAKSTSELKSFQNCIIMYAGKRCLLAALDYNHHNHRPDYIGRNNEKSYKRLYSKKSHNYRVQAVKVAKDYGYIPELQRCILRKRMDGGALPRKAKHRPGDPRHLGNLAGVVSPPPTAELVQTQIRRGQASAT
ncbi:hypothetical protein ABVT39_024048 [Epinephelus coioides]